MRKDVLAAGARSAKFAGGIGETDYDRNIMSEEDAAALDAQTAEIAVEKVETPKKTFRPRNDVVLVQRKSAEELSNVVITEMMEKEKPAEGTVISVGQKVLDLTPGDHIVFGKYAGEEFKLNGETLLLMNEEDVKGVIADADAVHIAYTPPPFTTFSANGNTTIGRA